MYCCSIREEEYKEIEDAINCCLEYFILKVDEY